MKKTITLNLGPSKQYLQEIMDRLHPAQRSLFRKQLNMALADIKNHFDPRTKCGWPLDFNFYSSSLVQPIIGPVDMFFAALLLEKKLDVKIGGNGKFSITKKEKKNANSKRR